MSRLILKNIIKSWLVKTFQMEDWKGFYVLFYFNLFLLSIFLKTCYSFWRFRWLDGFDFRFFSKVSTFLFEFLYHFILQTFISPSHNREILVALLCFALLSPGELCADLCAVQYCALCSLYYVRTLGSVHTLPRLLPLSSTLPPKRPSNASGIASAIIIYISISRTL